MLLVDFKRSKRMRYFHGSETECMFKNEVLSASVIVGCAAKVLSRRNVFPGDGLQEHRLVIFPGNTKRASLALAWCSRARG